MALKAEVLLGVQLVTRHRAPRLAAVLVLGIVAAAAASATPPDRAARLTLVLGATLSAVGASRLLAPGPALAAGRMVVAPWWLVPVGRLIGALCVVLPVTLGVALALAATSAEGGRVLASVTVAGAYAACVGAAVMSLAPACGASGAASLGFLGVWLGIGPPSDIGTLFAGWPPLQRVLVWAWNVLPLPWRPLRWLAGGPADDSLLLVAWTLIGLVLAAWQLLVPRAGRSRPE